MENFRLGAYQSRTQFLLFKKDFLGDTLAVARPHVCVFFSTSYKPSFLTSFYIGPACGPRRVVSLVVPDNKAALEAARGVAQTSICAVFPDPGGHVPDTAMVMAAGLGKRMRPLTARRSCVGPTAPLGLGGFRSASA